MKISVMGYGTVGSGVVEVIMMNNEQIVKNNCLDSLEISHILDLRDFPNLPFSDKFTKEFNDILNDDETKIVVETMGGLHPAYEFVKSCLQAGKSVCTSNKELVAAYGDELLKLAKEKDVNFLFEASVGGGIPIIRPIVKCLAGNKFNKVAGILNGTTNFILSKMIRDNMSLEEALKIAQENGYAEKDPTNDIEGHDACRKICILASLCFGDHIYPDEIKTEGITKISLSDVEYAKNCNRVIKLIGSAEKDENGKICAQVSPALISDASPLSAVNDVFNAIMVDGNAVDEVYFIGKGAGKLATASAVVGDVIDCAVNKGTIKNYFWNEHKSDVLVSSDDMPTALYIRGFASDKENAEKKIESVLGKVTYLKRENAPKDEIAFLTSCDIRKIQEEKIKSIDSLDIQSVIRLADY
ncbi:MAG: homoserine dehydrogenase [Clostridia bacterium]|nr:homoserine dehydrogenase [Clostridia bacterium]